MGALMKWAVAGLGYMGKKFLHDTTKLSDVTVVAVASEQESKPKAKEFDFFTSYSDMFSRPNFQAVYISTTPNKHFEILDMCVAARIPALCEKPIFYCQSEIDKFSRVSNPSFISENISFMFDSQVIELISGLNQGLFGEIREIKIVIKRKLNPLARLRIMNKFTSKGALHDFGIYGVHFLISIFHDLAVVDQKINYVFDNDYSGEITFLGNRFTNCKLIYSIENDAPNSILIIGSKINVEILDFLTENQTIKMCSNATKILSASKNSSYFSNLTRTVDLISREISDDLPQSKFVPLGNSLRTAEIIFKILRNKLER